MIVAGVDIGNLTCKAVVMEDGQVLSHKVLPGACEKCAAVEHVLDQAVKAARIPREEVKYIMSTGAGRRGIPFVQGTRTSTTCLAKGTRWLYPSARTVLDIGAETCDIIKLDEHGAIQNIQENDKCAAGTGVFFDTMAKFLGIPVDEMSALSLKANKAVQLTSMCVIFAEQELITYIHKDPPHPIEELVSGIHLSIALRVAGMVGRVGVEKDVVLVGGVGRNMGFVQILGERLGTKLLVPENPELVLALGAALIAREVFSPSPAQQTKGE